VIVVLPRERALLMWAVPELAIKAISRTERGNPRRLNKKAAQITIGKSLIPSIFSVTG
jgi:hypothetical protein